MSDRHTIYISIFINLTLRLLLHYSPEEVQIRPDDHSLSILVIVHRGDGVYSPKRRHPVEKQKTSLAKALVSILNEMVYISYVELYTTKNAAM